MKDIRLIFAFAEPPARFGFSLAKSGKCWFLKTEGREAALDIGKQLSQLGINGVIKKDQSQKRFSPR